MARCVGTYHTHTIHTHNKHTQTQVHVLPAQQKCQLSLWAPASYFSLNTSGMQVKG